MRNITFDGVRVVNAENDDVQKYYTCKGVESGVATGDTFPVPPCFRDETTRGGSGLAL